MKRAFFTLLLTLILGSASAAGLISASGARHFVPASAGGGGGGTILANLDYSLSATTTPNNGWAVRTVGHTDMWTQSRQAAAGPQGQDCYRITQNFSNTGLWGGDFSYGWGLSSLAPQSAGQSRFYRFRLKYSASTDFNGRDQETGAGENVLRNKFLIVGDSSSVSNSRVIIQGVGEPASVGGPRWLLGLQLDGGSSANAPSSGWYTSLNTWVDVQIEIKYSSSLDATDGYYRIWVDNNTYASPTNQHSGIVVNRPDTNTLSLGYENNGVVNGTQHEFEHCDFRVATEFDSAWNQ